MSLSLLPTELVRQIIESTVPSSLGSSTCNERYSTLRLLCLVSQLFRQIAQPLLWNSIRIRSTHRLDAVLDSAAANGGSRVIGKVVMDPGNYQSWSPGQISRLVEIGESLHTLILSSLYTDTIGLAMLSQLPNLTKLVLVNGPFPFSTHVILPKVKSLDIGYYSFDGVKSILNPKALPSLRELVLDDIGEDMDLDKLPRQPFVELLSQLEMLFLEFNQRRGIPDCIIPILSRTRFNHIVDHPGDFALLQQGIRHLRIEGMDCPSEGTYLEVVKSLTSELKLQDPPCLRTICFDNDVEIPSPNSSLDKIHREAVVELFQVLEGKGIEVYHEEDQGFRIDEGNSDEFARISKILEKKDKEQRK
ncbi:hypothetical protein JCM5353_002554 [Sporobolomyces roseus]